MSMVERFVQASRLREKTSCDTGVPAICLQNKAARKTPLPSLRGLSCLSLDLTQAETGDYGGVYFGNGLPNTDLQFML